MPCNMTPPETKLTTNPTVEVKGYFFFTRFHNRNSKTLKTEDITYID